MKEHAISIKTIYPYLKTKIPSTIQGNRIKVLINNKPIGMFINGSEGFSPSEAIEHQYETFREQSKDFCPKCYRTLMEKE